MLLNVNAVVVSLILDLVAVIVLLIFAIRSAKKGFVACVIGLLSTIVAGVVAFLLVNSVLTWTGGIFGLQGKLTNGCTNAFAKIAGFNVDISSEGLRASLTAKKLPAFLVNTIVDGIGNNTVPEGTTIAKLVGGTVAELIAKLIAFLLAFAVLKIVLKIVGNLLSGVINSLPIVGALNGLLGFVTGILQGAFTICVVLSIFSLIPSVGIINTFNSGTVLKFLYNHNFVLALLG